MNFNFKIQPKLRSNWLVTAAVAAGACAPAYAEVQASGANGFKLQYVLQSHLAPAAAYRRFIAVSQWWSSDHTYSGSAAALSIQPVVGGCWCEVLRHHGGVRHMSVSYVAPGQAIRLEGGLGPLQAMGVSGALTVIFKAQGAGTEVKVVYAVSGYQPDGFVGVAPDVDQVLGEQLAHYAADH